MLNLNVFMRAFVMLCILGSLLVVVPGCGGSSIEVVRLPADQLIAQNILELVESTISKVNSDVGSADLHGELAMVYEANGLFELGSKSYQNAAFLDPGEKAWALHFAICEINLGRYEIADPVLKALLERESSFGPAWYWLGRVQLVDGDTSEALKSFLKAKKISPISSAVTVAVADCYVRLGDYQKAADLLSPLVSDKPTHEYAQYVLGLAYRGLKQRDRSMHHMKLGMGQIPSPLDDEIAVKLKKYRRGIANIVERAVVAINQGKPQVAIKILEQALKYTPKEVSLLNNLASAYSALGQLDKALSILKKAHDLEPMNFRTSLNRSAVLQKQGKFKEALNSAEEVCVSAPQVVEGYIRKAQILLSQKRVKEAIPVLTQALEVNQNHGWVNAQFGTINAQSGNWALAVKYYRRALPNSVDKQNVMLGLSWSLAEAGDLPAAKRYLQLIRKKWPRDARANKIADVIRQKEARQ